MPKRVSGLSAAAVRVAKPGRFCDGDGLYLLVRTPETAWWIFRYARAGRSREMGLGRARGRNSVSLAEAREKAAVLHRQVRAGGDPLAERDADRAAALAEAQTAAATATTFAAAASL